MDNTQPVPPVADQSSQQQTPCDINNDMANDHCHEMSTGDNGDMPNNSLSSPLVPVAASDSVGQETDRSAASDNVTPPESSSPASDGRSVGRDPGPVAPEEVGGEQRPPLPPPTPPPDTNHRQSAAGEPDGPLSQELADCSIDDSPIVYSNYESELQMPEIMQLIQRDLSEPYSIYTYRYFINNWPNLCFLARHRGRIVGAIVCKLDSHDSHTKRVVTSRGYIAMLAVDQRFRKRRIGSCLVLNAIRAMASDAADEVVLETEVTNKGALRLYENLGFVRDKRLFRYYLNGVDALRLKLWLWPP